MSRHWIRDAGRPAARAIGGVIAASLIATSVPAFAAESAADAATLPASAISPVSRPLSSLERAASRDIQTAFEQSIKLEARRLAVNTQSGSDSRSGRWCFPGLALAAAGIVTAVVSGVHDDNPQNPSPPVGFVLGTAAGVVGGVMMLRSCGK
jgi:poly(3-hydroxybutyrate) depolymerase